MIIDVHNMIGSRPHHETRTAEMLLREMDQADVDRAVVSCFAMHDDNDLVLQAVRAYPDRLTGMYLTNPFDPCSVEKYKNYLAQGFRALRLEPLAHGYPVNSIELISPLMNLCTEYRTPVWVYGTADVYCSPILFCDLAEAFPFVPIIIGYMGFNYEAASAISIAKRFSNVYLDSTAVMFQNLKRAVSVAGPEKLLLGSGTPVASYFALEIEKIRLVLADKKDQALVLSENAIRLFGLNA